MTSHHEMAQETILAAFEKAKRGDVNAMKLYLQATGYLDRKDETPDFKVSADEYFMIWEDAKRLVEEYKRTSGAVPVRTDTTGSV